MKLLLALALSCVSPARAQLGGGLGPGLGLGGTIPVYEKPVPQEGQKPAQLNVQRKATGGVRVLAVSLKGLLAKSWLIPSVSSVHGFVVDDKRGDVILIARTGGKTNLDWRDFSEALRAALNGGEDPYCSLDPNIANPSGPQGVRVGGVRRWSHFAKVMLDADYLMKQSAAGIVATPSLTSFTDRLINALNADCGAMNGTQLWNRFWFYPGAPQTDDAKASSSGKTVWVKARVRLLTEEMFAAQGSWAGKGHANAYAAAYSSDFTNRFDDLSAQPGFALFDQLKSLFQWVSIAHLAARRSEPAASGVLSSWAANLGDNDSGWTGYAGLSRTIQVPRCNMEATQSGGVSIPSTVPATLQTDSEISGLEGIVLDAAAAAPDEMSWSMETGMPESSFTR